jgi:hypothetical protein
VARADKQVVHCKISFDNTQNPVASSLCGDISPLTIGGTETRRYVCHDLFYNVVHCNICFERLPYFDFGVRPDSRDACAEAKTSALHNLFYSAIYLKSKMLLIIWKV